MRIQLCGLFRIDADGRTLEASLPGRQGRMLFAYLVLNRARPVPRDELFEALWPDSVPAQATASLSVLLSKLRAALVPARIEGRSELHLVLPVPTQVDVEHALESVHSAETAVAVGDWRRAWAPAKAACYVAERPLLVDCEAPWLDEWRRRLGDVHVRALECYAAACLGIGGAELSGAERAARRLIELSPFRENGYRLLMESLAARGNVAEAVRVYDDLRRLFRDELGIAPGASVQEVHKRLLGATGA
jgi:DNA-binding SARP family transcriptional activator